MNLESSSPTSVVTRLDQFATIPKSCGFLFQVFRFIEIVLCFSGICFHVPALSYKLIVRLGTSYLIPCTPKVSNGCTHCSSNQMQVSDSLGSLAHPVNKFV